MDVVFSGKFTHCSVRSLFIIIQNGALEVYLFAFNSAFPRGLSDIRRSD
jgi:hypothetical protein